MCARMLRSQHAGARPPSARPLLRHRRATTQMTSLPKPTLRRAQYVKVSDLSPDTSGHNLVLRVLRSRVVVDSLRVDGVRNVVAEVTLGDETGCVTLRARNEQVDLVSSSAAVVLRNARVLMFKGFVRLVVTKWGKLSKYPDGIASTPPAPELVNEENNVSLVKYDVAPNLGERSLDEEEFDLEGASYPQEGEVDQVAEGELDLGEGRDAEMSAAIS